MKYQVFYKLGDTAHSDFFYGDNPGEAFAKCLLQDSNRILIKCRKGGEEIGDAFTEWDAPPVQRQPEEPPYVPPPRKIPKYKEEKDPMPAMKDWYEKKKNEATSKHVQ